jgi:hypothetical protein
MSVFVTPSNTSLGGRVRDKVSFATAGARVAQLNR